MNKIYPVLILGLAIFFSCQSKSELQRNIRKEMATGVQNDSLFLGLEFGLTLQEFYDHCWELNRKGIVKEGPKNMSVEYIFKDSLDNPIAFNFYAEENEEGLVYQYNASFYYYAFALNRHLQSDRLMEMLPTILMDWYGGNAPFAMEKEGKEHLYKIDGNRMIDLYIYDQSTVIATYYDLSYLYPQLSK